MAKDKEGQSIRDYGTRKKRIKRIRRIIIVTLIIALAAAGAIYVYRLYNKNYKSYEVINSMDNATESGVEYLSYGSCIVKYSRDGAAAIDKDGNLLWNGSYEMNKPVADICGDYVAIADEGGKSVQIFDKKGSAGTITTIYDIIKVEVASQGVTAVLMEDDKSNYIALYDVDGTDLADIQTNMAEDGYPVDITLSNDGKKLITDYLSMNGGELTGVTTFYNFGEVGQNWTDRIMGSYLFDNIVSPRVVFNNNDAACVFKDNGFLIFKYSEEPKLVKEETFEGEIKSILYNKSYVGVVLGGGEAGNRELILYDLAGNQVLDKKIDYNYNNIYMTDEEIIMHDNTSCMIMKPNGSVKFSHTFDTNISTLYPINHLDRYFLISGSQISQISLME